MSTAIVSMLVSASIVNGEAQVPPIVIFGTFAVLNAVVGLRIYSGITEDASEARPVGQLVGNPASG